MDRKEFLKLIGLSGSNFLFAGVGLPQFNLAYQIQTVTIYDNYIKGEFYYKEYLQSMKLFINQPVVLQRDYQNSYDKFAVKVLIDDKQIGYLAAYENIVLANMLDKGVDLKAFISELNFNHKELKNRIEEAYLYNMIGIKVQTDLMLPVQNYNIIDLTNERADNQPDKYRGEF